MTCIYKMNTKLAELLKIEKGITAVIGGGGKTSLINCLARELGQESTVIICTTTKIRAPENIRLICPDDKDSIKIALADVSKIDEKIICVAGESDMPGKLKTPNTSLDELSAMADYVLVEADGSKQLPLKAHAEHEPVIPDNANQTILVMGVDGIGKKIGESCHRPELYVQKLTAVSSHKENTAPEANLVSVENVVTPKLAMSLVKAEGLGTRIYINKVEHENDLRVAEEMVAETDLPVAAGSLKQGAYRCLR